jgi:hypothetical protein
MTSRSLRPLLALLACVGALAASGCRSCEDESEEEEERNQLRDHYWRPQIVVVGRGAVRTRATLFDCASDGAGARGECGPKLVTFKEGQPPLLEALPAPGWRFEHWGSLVREGDGSVHPRPGPMPDGRFYLNGMGYTDTGQLETVTATFVPDGDAQVGVQP